MGIFDIKKIRYISHRGFQPMAPENSLPSFTYAGVLGQWAIETDVRMTKDGELICCHNDSVDSYCDGVGKITDMTLSEIRKLRIIKGNRADCFTDDEARIPTFAEYLAICKRYGSVPFIELKIADAERVIYAVRSAGFSDDEVVMSAIKLPGLIETRRVTDKMFIHWIFAEEDRLPELSKLGFAGYSLNIPDSFSCPESKIREGHDMGLKVCLRAADSVKVVKHMQALGLDYLPSNCMHESIFRG